MCYKCNNYGHIAKFYRSDFKKKKKDDASTIMEINQEQGEQKKEKSVFAQVSLCAQNNRDKWYIDNGCSSHMTGDKKKLITLKKNEGIVTFQDNDTSNIVGKYTLSLDNGRDKLEKVLSIEDLKHTLLSVSHMCDQGHTLTFDSQACKIRNPNSSKLVAKAIRTQNDVYILDEFNREKSFMGKIDES
jgi:hypothetical protein